MKRVIDIFFTTLALVFAVPTSLILVSWNAIPGDYLYSLKRSLEGVALAITIRTPIAQAFSLKFTDRRFSEANRLLSKRGSTLGYSFLVEGARETKDIIIDKKDSQSAAELVSKIDEYQKTIEEKQAVIQAQSPQNQEPTAQTTTSKDEVVQDLKKTKDDLEKIKDDIKKELPEAASEKAKEIHDNKDQDRQDKRDDNGESRNKRD